MPSSIATAIRSRCFYLVSFLLLAFTAPASATPTIGGVGTGASYTEVGSVATVAPAITITGGTDYLGGSLQFAISSSTSTETLALATVSSPSTTNGAVSVVGTSVYLGDGTTANRIGSVDGTANGAAGQPLKINFNTSAFANASFEDGTTTGWAITNGRAITGTTLIGGYPVPTDPTIAGNSSGDAGSASMTYSHSISTNVLGGGANGTKSLSLSLSGSSASYGTVHGPYAVSQSAFSLNAGDSITFWWSAAAAGDAYDVFGYLLNVDTGATTILINATGSSGSATQAWTQVSQTISTAGNYKFVFLSGSYDFSGGTALGANLLIDNVEVVSSVTSVSDSVVEALARLVTYQDSSRDPAASRTITITATATDSTVGTATSSITITRANDAPTLTGSTTLTYTWNSAATAVCANLSISDPDDTTLTGGNVSISSGHQNDDTLALTVNSLTMGNLTSSYDSSTGVLTISGTATLAQYQAALRAVSFATSSNNLSARTVTFSVTDADAVGTGALSGSAAVTITVADTTAPVITSATTATATYRNAFSAYTATATDITAVTYGATGLPAGLSINTATGAISGTPTGIGTSSVILTATDVAGNVGQTTLTVTVASASLTVSGLTVADKVYDGSTSATLSTSGASLSGVLGGDSVTLDTSGASATFTTADAGTGKSVTVTGLALSGAAATNYSLTQPSGITGNISRATAGVTITNLAQTYNGSAKTVSVTTSPTGLASSVTYAGSSTAPTDAGTYTVVGTVNTTNHTGTATASLVIAKADQSITFNPIGSLTVGSPTALSATASSGLPVSFTITSGNATIDGAVLTPLDGNPVTVRASQAGNGNYQAATSQQTSGSITKLAQSIAFAPLADQPSTSAPLTLSATASSGLPVSFGVVSGPGILSGTTLTLTGASGTVMVRASQAGNAVYSAATPVDRSFTVTAVGPQVFFGLTSANDILAANISQDNQSGTIIGFLSGTSEAFVLTFTLPADGVFSGEAQIFTQPVSTSATTKQPGAIRSAITASGTRTFTGTMANGVISGSISGLNTTFVANLESPSGPSASVAGYYTALSTSTAEGTTYAIVSPQSRTYVLAITPQLIASATATVNSDLTFSATTAQAVTITGSLNSTDTTVTGTLTLPDATTQTFSGAASTTLRTDRVFSLSSRGSIAPASEYTLITGFHIAGPSPKAVLLRAAGPALSAFGVSNALVDPRIRLHHADGSIIAENDNWSGSDISTAASRVGAFSFAEGSKDAALLMTLNPGDYTVHVLDGNGTGVTLAEIYDASANPQGEYQRLISISSRGRVAAGEGVLIGGFILSGNTPKKVLVRGAGPTLSNYGVQNVLTDPVLKIYNENGVLIAQNDNWETPVTTLAGQTSATASEIASTSSAVGAFAFRAGSKDASIIITLAPGAYTAQITSQTGIEGVALIEVYEIP